MKRLFLLFLFAGIGMTTVHAQTDVKIKKNKFTVAGAWVNKTWALSDAQAKLGSADRTRDGYNKTHTYDTRGIVLFEKSVDKVASGIITEVQFHFNVPEPNQVTPTGTFTGTLAVDKLIATANTSAADMLKQLKVGKHNGWKKTDSYMEHSYRMQKGHLYIYFQFNDAEDHLQKVSVGPAKD